jgi:hypothetical protein
MDDIEVFNNNCEIIEGLYCIETDNYFPLRGNGWYHRGDVLALWSWHRIGNRLIVSSSPTPRSYGGAFMVWPEMQFPNRW